MESRRDRKKANNALSKENTRRIMVFIITIIVIVSLLVARLAYIQLYKGEELAQRALHQWIREIPVGSQRGIIYDRNMNPLTDRESSDYLYIFPEYFSKTEENIKVIKEITGILEDRISDNLGKSRPFALQIENFNDKILKKASQTRGVFPIKSEERYSTDGLAAHVIGYINKIDNTGEYGLEKSYNEILKNNHQYFIGAVVDAHKRLIPGLEYRVVEESDKPKYNLVTTLDLNIQKIVEEELDSTGKKGSVVVLDSQSGEILAMASRPTYNPDNLVENLSSNDKELYNRAIQIAYPPGSIFKIVVLAAALEEGIVSEDEEFFCQGYEEIGNVRIKCSSYEKGGHGYINLQDAFSQSCNSTFIQLGQLLGGERIIETAQNLGLGRLTEIELPEETEGQLPTLDYTKGAGIGNISIGQGTLEVTPLQITRMTQIIANDGVEIGINLVKMIVDDEKRILEVPEKQKAIPRISINTARQVQNMMEKVVLSGTGRRIDVDGGAAGKTGSAEAFSNGTDTVHAWFTGYFPRENPQYIITVLVEDGGSGGTIAAPIFNNIAKRVLESSK